MKILTDERQTKLCHGNPGDVVQLSSGGTLYMICVQPERGKRPGRANMSQGLYDDERNLYLVDLQTGYMKEMVHLSTKVTFRPDIAITSNALPENE